MKPALAYSIVMRFGHPTVVAITSERAHRWWGRDCRNDLGTHGTGADLCGRFETREDADKTLEAVAAVKSHFSVQRSRLNAAQDRLHRAEQAMVAQVTSRLPKRGAEMLVVTVSIQEMQP